MTSGDDTGYAARANDDRFDASPVPEGQRTLRYFGRWIAEQVSRTRECIAILGIL